MIHHAKSSQAIPILNSPFSIILGSDHQQRKADKQDAEVDKLGLDVLLMQYEDSVEEGYKDTSTPDHRYYGYH